MEPVTTVEGLKVIQNPDESRNLLGAYYESLGFHVMKPEAKPAGKPANSAHTAMAGTR